jgi:hypothetical protein
MRKLAITLGVAAAVIGAGFFAWNAEATTSTAAATLGATAKNYSPVQKAACRGWDPTAPRDSPGGVAPTGAGALLARLSALTHRLFEAAPSRGRPHPI